MKKLIIALSILSISSFTAANEYTEYQEKIEKLKENGVINDKEAEEQLLQMKLNSNKKHNNFKKQVRGVASTLKEVKIYKIQSEPIEIP